MTRSADSAAPISPPGWPPGGAPPQSIVGTLRVATLNVAHGRRDAFNQLLVGHATVKRNLEAIARLLRETKADATTHLIRKLADLERHEAVPTTEQLFDLAATKSSGGKPCHVRCGQAAPLESRERPTAKLAALRNGDPGFGERPLGAVAPASAPTP